MRAITVTAPDGAIYEATQEAEGDAWQINFPEGGYRFHGTEAEVRREIGRHIADRPACPGRATADIGWRP